MILKELFNIAYDRKYLEKVAGGPGSGVTGYNTVTHPLTKSKYVSVGTRQALLDHMDFEEAEIPVYEITHSCQDKYVPEKVQRMMQNPEIIKAKPIDVLIAPNEVVVVDGNHRLLAARNLGIKSIKARFFRSRKIENWNVNKKIVDTSSKNS